jgi:Bacterial cell division membrane protein
MFDQPDLSTCLFTLVIVLGIVFSAGISYRWIIGVLSVTVPMVGACVDMLLHGLIPFIKEYQAGRILALVLP